MAKADEANTPAPDTVEGEGQGWRPTEGDVITGKIVAVGKAWSDWTNSFYPLVTIHDEDQGKDVDVHAFHHTLQSALMENKPKVGDRVSIAYLGKRATKDGKRQVAIYRVTLPDATGTEVWESLEGQRPAAAAAAKQGELPGYDEDIPF
jgi:hypothetical protein